MRILSNKKGFELSFAMIFSIIAGVIILFLAIYATTRFIQTSQYSSYSESALDLSNILNPIVNGISSASRAPEINFKKETRIFLGCEADYLANSIFGVQQLSFSEQSGFLGGWTSPGANISRNNKYIFGENQQQGKIMWIFSKPFYLGFRVDDLIFISLKEYCFVTPPEYIEEEIKTLEIKNINITNQISQCKKNALKVCFGFAGTGCNMSVYPDNTNYEVGRIVKPGKTLDYVGSLIYAGIFSSPNIYECNLKRLGIKTTELASLYKEKIDLVVGKQCNSQIQANLNNMISLANNLTISKLKPLYQEASLMDDKNQRAECQIYSGEDY